MDDPEQPQPVELPAEKPKPKRPRKPRAPKAAPPADPISEVIPEAIPEAKTAPKPSNTPDTKELLKVWGYAIVVGGLLYAGQSTVNDTSSQLEECANVRFTLIDENLKYILARVDHIAAIEVSPNRQDKVILELNKKSEALFSDIQKNIAGMNETYSQTKIICSKISSIRDQSLIINALMSVILFLAGWEISRMSPRR